MKNDLLLKQKINFMTAKKYKVYKKMFWRYVVLCYENNDRKIPSFTDYVKGVDALVSVCNNSKKETINYLKQL